MKLNSNKVGYIIVIFLFFYAFLPTIAPVLVWLGDTTISSWIYSVYSLFCHQKSSRSIFICGNQCGLCARCTFIWWSLFFSAFYTFVGFAKYYIKPLHWAFAAGLMLPMIFDGGLQFVATLVSIYTQTDPFYESTNTIRAITGSLFGIGLGLFIFPLLKTDFNNDN